MDLIGVGGGGGWGCQIMLVSVNTCREWGGGSGFRPLIFACYGKPVLLDQEGHQPHTCRLYDVICVYVYVCLVFSGSQIVCLHSENLH